MSEVLVMVGTQKGAFLLRSDEARREWRVDGPYLKGWEVSCMTRDPRDGTLWAGVGHFIYGATVQRSTDLGETWEQVENGPAYSAESGHKLNRIWTIVPGRASEPGVLYAGVDEAGLFRSEDGGETWHGLDGLNEHATRPAWGPGAGGLCCHTVLLDPGDDKRLWVGISAVGSFRSDDGGESFAVKTDGLPIIEPKKEYPGVGTCVHRMVLDPSRPDVLYQQNHQGVFKSEDGADSWRRIEEGLPSIFGFPMVMHPRDSRTVFTVPLESDEFRMPEDGELAVYRTRDGGESWQRLRTGLPSASFQGVLRGAMSVDSLDPCGVYFGNTGGQVFLSADEGENWHEIPAQLPRISSVTATVLET